MPAVWETATVVAVHDETARAKTLRLRLGAPTSHLAGQHYVVRLTAPDGYTASRSYSIASPPDDGNELDLTVERLDDGEVSSFLHDVLEVGDELEVRGPIGGYFVWDGTTPALLLGGGSGVVPLMAMLRLARATGDDGSAHLVVSVRTPDDLYYADELTGRDDVTVLYTRATPPRLAASCRPPRSRRPRTPPPRRPDRLRVRLGAVHRRGRRPARRPRCPARTRALRALRSQR